MAEVGSNSEISRHRDFTLVKYWLIVTPFEQLTGARSLKTAILHHSSLRRVSNHHVMVNAPRSAVYQTTSFTVPDSIPVAAQWYQNHLGGATRVLLITNERENRRKAIEEGICAETIMLDLTWLICLVFTVESYVRSLGQTHLLDLLVQSANEDANMEDVEDLRPSKRKVLYSEKLLRGIYHQGKLRVNRYNPFEAYVGDDEEEDVHLVLGSADDASRAASVLQGSDGDSSSSSPRPAGRVIGIIKRNCIHKLSWHYCGSLNPMPIHAGSGGIVYALFVSKDRRIPKIRIQTRQLENLLDERIIVGVNSWDRLSRYPSGNYVRSIREIGDRDTESEV
ncbi:exosome complex exonuclease RRP44-like protein A [Cucumis melo var. makuwa]|uniref:Exosome complex exonuclease RRP44-like protein A n=1 Tax=Cucumis melo var. makuwa TaxID=1194695 RepID=A0A5A7U009_CUCMM|nr:exosome complex exonuclease RRP44-like protein A [Cucumis melo var. makuwa]